MDKKICFNFSVPELDNDVSIKDLFSSLKTHDENLRSNLRYVQKNILNRPAESCDELTASWIDDMKYTIMDYLIKTKHNKTIDEFEGTFDTYIELYKYLVSDNRQSAEVISYLYEEIKQSKENLREIKKSLELMQNINKLVPGPARLNLDAINSKITKIFREKQEDLHTVLDHCFEENSMKQLVIELTDAYFRDGSDKYIELSDDAQFSYKNLEILKRAFLIVTDPNNNRRIKFDNIE